MVNDIRFTNFVTKGFEADADEEKRIIKGFITAEVIDRQDEFIAVQEMAKVMPIFMKGLAPFSETHSNRMVGKADGWEVSEIEGHPAIKVWGHIFKQEGVTLYDRVWDLIKSGEYKGFSLGGASKVRTPIFKDGKYAMELKNLELYEIAICKSPANQLAIVDYVNMFAKDMPEGMIKNIDGRSYIQCNSIECLISKAIDSDVDIDVDHTGGDNNEIITKNAYTLNVNIDTNSNDFIKIVSDIVRSELAKIGGGGISMEKDKSDVKEAIQREHELTGDKPSPKEEKIHEQVVSETKKDHIPGEHEGLEFPKKHKDVSKAVAAEVTEKLRKTLKQ